MVETETGSGESEAVGQGEGAMIVLGFAPIITTVCVL